MMAPLVIVGSVRFRSRCSNGTINGPRPAVSVPRVARLMALAIRFDHLLAEGVVKNYAELARLGHVSRSRISQIMGLLNLAPDLQEQVLFLSHSDRGRAGIHLGDLSSIASIPDWQEQRRRWRARGLSMPQRRT